MANFISLCLTIYLWTVTAIATIVSFVVCLLFYPFISERTFGYLYTKVFGDMIMYSMTIPRFWTLKITDLRDPADQNFKNQYIIISNHASFIDTLVASRIPLVKKFIMAKEFMSVPVFGWLCRSSGHIPVCSRDRKSITSAIDLSVKAMDDGSSFMIYPEGKRSKNPNEVLPFKTGAFRLARRTGVPILPIIIKGTGKAMPIGGFCYPAKMELIIGKPFNVSNDYEDIREDPVFTESYQFIQSHLSKTLIL